MTSNSPIDLTLDKDESPAEGHLYPEIFFFQTNIECLEFFNDYGFRSNNLFEFLNLSKSFIEKTIHKDIKLSFTVYLGKDFLGICYGSNFLDNIMVKEQILIKCSRGRANKFKIYETITSEILSHQVTLYNRLNIERNIDKVGQLELTILKDKRGQGYSYSVINHAFELFKNRGYLAVFLICSCPISQRIALKSGAACYKSFNYRKTFGLDMVGTIDIWYKLL